MGRYGPCRVGYDPGMSGDAAHTIEREFPNLAPDVVEGYRTAPETMVAEILDGALSLMPRPRLGHATAAEGLSEELGPPFRRGRGGPGGWVILPEPELHLGPLPDVLVPDLAGWRRERLPDGFIAGAFASVAPDWCCEVLSPSTERVDRGRKLAIYHREGVGHVWLVSPTLRSVEVYRRADIGWLLLATFEGDALVRAEPFDAVPIDLAGLWAL
jgi:Uma2 family endonuclease